MAGSAADGGMFLSSEGDWILWRLWKKSKTKTKTE